MMLFLVFASKSLYAQFFVGDVLKISAGSEVYVYESDFVNNSNASIVSDGLLHNKSTNFFVSPGAALTGSGVLVFDGTAPQIIDGNEVLFDCDVEINNSGNVSLSTLSLLPSAIPNNNLFLNKSLIFTLGDFITSTNKVVFSSSSNYSGASNNSHINGWSSKIGNTSFIFPVGNGVLMRDLSITSPSNITDRFECKYIQADPSPSYPDNLMAPTLYAISSCEYWLLYNTNGSSAVNVNLTWNDQTSCGITNPLDLRVARWDGALWQDHGNGGTNGSSNFGSIVTSALVNSFGPFTLATISDDNPLPITLIDFKAEYLSDKEYVDLTWQTYSEINNDYFTVEKSRDGKVWVEVDIVPGASNHVGFLEYSSLDEEPFVGLSYYRLKQTDFDGLTSYSEPRSINISNLTYAYPNPFYDILQINASNLLIDRIEIVNSLGQNVKSIVCSQIKPEILDLSLKDLESGLYNVRIINSNNVITKSVIKL